MEINSQDFDILNSSSYGWYKAPIPGKWQETIRLCSWINELAQFSSATPIVWVATHTLPFKTTRETKLQSFHYQIIHHLITCNRYLHTMSHTWELGWPFSQREKKSYASQMTMVTVNIPKWLTRCWLLPNSTCISETFSTKVKPAWLPTWQK